MNTSLLTKTTRLTLIALAMLAALILGTPAAD